jgi:hypothetical protein
MAVRTAFVERFTKETKVQVSLSLDGGPLDLLPNHLATPGVPDQNTQHHASQDSTSQQIWIWTGIGFLDHMLHALAKHGGWSLRIRAVGDLASKYFMLLLLYIPIYNMKYPLYLPCFCHTTVEESRSGSKTLSLSRV